MGVDVDAEPTHHRPVFAAAQGLRLLRPIDPADAIAKRFSPSFVRPVCRKRLTR